MRKSERDAEGMAERGKGKESGRTGARERERERKRERPREGVRGRERERNERYGGSERSSITILRGEWVMNEASGSRMKSEKARPRGRWEANAEPPVQSTRCPLARVKLSRS